VPPKTTRGSQVTSNWNWSFNDAADDQQTQSAGTTTKWNMSMTDVIRPVGQFRTSMFLPRDAYA